MSLTEKEEQEFMAQWADLLRKVPHREGCHRSGEPYDHRCTCDIGEPLLRLHNCFTGLLFRARSWKSL